METDPEPHVPEDRPWRRLDNLANTPRCGAKTRCGTPCKGPAVHGKRRCRKHGGFSTGPRTPEGKERSRLAHLTHGRRSGLYVMLMRSLREIARAQARTIELAKAGVMSAEAIRREVEAQQTLIRGFELVQAQQAARQKVRAARDEPAADPEP